jgi:hypothetical protein
MKRGRELARGSADSSKGIMLDYDPESGKLRVGSVLIREFAAQATSLRIFWSAYERQSRPREIRNPFRGPKAYEKLRNVVKALQRDERVRRYVRFHLNGKRNGVRWQPFGDWEALS